MREDEIILYAKLDYAGMDTDGNIHLILKREKSPESCVKFLKAYEGLDIMIKIAPIDRKTNIHRSC